MAEVHQSVDNVHDPVNEVVSRLKSLAQSQAAASSRLDGAFVGVVNGQTAVLAAAAAMGTSQAATKRTRKTTEPPSKKAKTVFLSARPSTSVPGGGAALSMAGAAESYHCVLVHDWAMPAEMLTAAFVSQPLLMQLAAMVRMCHVSVDHHGLFGSYACLRLYKEGMVQTTKVLNDGGTTGTINAAKTEKMRSVIKHKADLWLRQLYWLQGVLPNVLKAPQEATYEHMFAVKLSDADCNL